MEIIKNNNKEKTIAFTIKDTLYEIKKKHYDTNKNLLEYIEDAKVISKNNEYTTMETDDSTIVKIKPYTGLHVRKYSDKKKYIYEETPQRYREYLETFVKKTLPVKWVDDILNGSAEQENVLIKSTDYFVTKDMKWSGKKEDLYLLVIFKNNKLKSIRDLNSSHISLLKHSKNTVMWYIEKTYKIPSTRIKTYFHYHPTFWHLHLHVEHIDSSIGKSDIYDAVSLDEVIFNLNIDSHYYKNKIFYLKKSI